MKKKQAPLGRTPGVFLALARLIQIRFGLHGVCLTFRSYYNLLKENQLSLPWTTKKSPGQLTPRSTNKVCKGPERPGRSSPDSRWRCQNTITKTHLDAPLECNRSSTRCNSRLQDTSDLQQTLRVTRFDCNTSPVDQKPHPSTTS